MKPGQVGAELRRARQEAGLTQRVLAGRMGTSQPNIARAESGLVEPTLDFIERFAVATGRPLRLGAIVIWPSEREVDRPAARVERAIGDYQFNPWQRAPSATEQRALNRRGLTRERFERTPPADAR